MAAKRQTDLLGVPAAPTDLQALTIYRGLKELAARPDLPPCAARGVRKALACMWNVVNDLDLEFEQLSDLGV
jgi:hypothetical protein